MNYFRSNFFPAKPAPPPEKPKAAEPEYMQVRVDHDPIKPTETMREFAQQILNNPAWENTCRWLRQQQIDMMVLSAPDRVDVREAAYKRLQAIDDITLHLGSLAAPEHLNIKPKRLTQPG